MVVVGVSFDPPEANARFREKYGFGFELWTDASRALAMHFGAARDASASVASRVTAILDADGRLVAHYPKVVNVMGHPQAVLDDCRALFGAE